MILFFQVLGKCKGRHNIGVGWPNANEPAPPRAGFVPADIIFWGCLHQRIGVSSKEGRKATAWPYDFWWRCKSALSFVARPPHPVAPGTRSLPTHYWSQNMGWDLSRAPEQDLKTALVKCGSIRWPYGRGVSMAVKEDHWPNPVMGNIIITEKQIGVQDSFRFILSQNIH